MGNWKPRTLPDLIREFDREKDRSRRRSTQSTLRADEAQATAVDAATAAADAASAAADANQAALDAAGIAADKGTVYAQPTAPDPVDLNGLWIDTDDGNRPNKGQLVDGVPTWVPVQDAGIQAAANAAAAAAQQAADAAAAAAAAQGTANKAVSDAAAAQGTANDAKTAAANAKTAADAAQGSANDAKTAASGAQSTANGAVTAAGNAKTAADAAKTAADSAASAASTAKSAADAAQARADQAAFGTFAADPDTTKSNQWIRAIYKETSGRGGWQPTYADIIGRAPTSVDYITDAALSGSAAWTFGDYYFGLVRGIITVTTTTTITFTYSADDASRIYVDGKTVKTSTGSGPAGSVSFTVTAGPHVVDFLVYENAGQDYINSVQPPIAGQVASLYPPKSLSLADAQATAALLDAQTAQATANGAKTDAATAQTAANTAQTAANTAKSAADAAKSAADAAQSTANGAKTAADNAQSSANGAQSTANTAITNAGNAKTAADNAAAAAASAAGAAAAKSDVLYQSATPDSSYQKTATLWIDTTNGANTPKRWSGSAWVAVTDKAATDAATAAAAASTLAGTKADVLIQSATPAAGYQKATTLWIDTTSSANTPKRWSGSAWIATTDKAATDAATAAANAAAAAAAKADVLIQGTAPATAMQKATTLWIDTTNGANTPKRWDGSAWVVVTDKAATDAAAAAAAAANAAAAAQSTANQAVSDAAAAQSAANIAKQTADAAQTAATNAQTSANGKNTVRFRDAAPTTSASDAGSADGDLWFVIPNVQTGIVTGQYVWFAANQAWVQQTLNSTVLASIDAGKITTGTLVGITITGVTITGATITGGVVQTASTGQRAVMKEARVDFYDENNRYAGGIIGLGNGASGGLLNIAPTPGGEKGIFVGNYYLPLYGTADVAAPSAYFPTLYADQIVNPATMERFQGTYIGTRTQSVGNAVLSGIGVFSAASGSATSFITMGGDGRFTLQSGAYIIGVIMGLTGSKATGRTFVEFIDSNDTSLQSPRGNMTPNVSEDTTSTSGAVNVPTTRTFRVQCYQTSGGSQNVRFTLSVTRIG